MAIGNTGTRLVGNTEFYGGISTDPKIGIENSYADAECLDVRKSPGQMTVLPQSRQFSGSSSIDGLVVAMEQSKDGNIWAIDENGKLYKIDEDNNITVVGGGKAEVAFVSQTLSNVTCNGETINHSYNSDGILTFTYTTSDSKWTVSPLPSKPTGWDGKMTKLELYLKYGIDYSGTPTNYDEITVNYAQGPFSSGFGLSYFQISDGLFFTDAGHTLFNYGKILNPTGQSVGTNMFELIADESARIVNEIRIQQKDDNIFYWAGETARADATNYTIVPTSISETEANKALLIAAISPIAQINVKFTQLGTGNVKLVIHDVNNNVVASSNPIDASDMSTSGYTTFKIFPDPTELISAKNQFLFTPWAGDTLDQGSELHIHVVASTGNFRVSSVDSGSMWTGLNMTVDGYALAETFNKKHPMAVFDKVYIGNGQYVASMANTPLNAISDTWYLPHQLRLDDGYEVCSMSTTDEYLIIGAEKTSTSSKRGFQQGRIYFWDFQSQGPCFYIDCNMGSPQSMINHDNIVYIVIAGALYAYTGGKELVKVRTLKGTDTEYSGSSSLTEVYPNMMTIRREIMLCGFPSTTTAQTIRYGIHGWGSVDKNYPNCWTYNYRIPGDYEYNTDLTQLRMGCVYNFNDTLFYSYQTTITDEETETTTTEYALGVVDNDSGTSDKFYYHSLVYDGGAPILEKDALRVGIKFDPLPTGCTITPIYKIDDGDWVTGSNTATAGDISVKTEVEFGNRRMHEFQFGFVGTTQNGTITPVIKQVAAEIRILDEEMKF